MLESLQSLAGSVIGVALMIATGAGRRLAAICAISLRALLYLFFDQTFMFFYFG